MSTFFYLEDGYYYPTTVGSIMMYVLAIAAVIVAGIAISKSTKKTKMSVKQLVFCAVAIALAYLTSYIRLWKMPYGGAVTLCSMMFICMIGYFYGLRAGLLTGFAYSILQFMQEPYVLTFIQVCCDYFLAFTALGLAGLFANRKNGMIKGYIVGVIGRGIFAVIAGYVFWSSSMPEDFPQSFAWAYPVWYNGMYLLVEGILTVIILSLPPVKRAINQIKVTAQE